MKLSWCFGKNSTPKSILLAEEASINNERNILVLLSAVHLGLYVTFSYMTMLTYRNK